VHKRCCHDKSDLCFSEHTGNPHGHGLEDVMTHEAWCATSSCVLCYINPRQLVMTRQAWCATCASSCAQPLTSIVWLAPRTRCRRQEEEGGPSKMSPTSLHAMPNVVWPSTAVNVSPIKTNPEASAAPPLLSPVTWKKPERRRRNLKPRPACFILSPLPFAAQAAVTGHELFGQQATSHKTHICRVSTTR